MHIYIITLFLLPCLSTTSLLSAHLPTLQQNITTLQQEIQQAKLAIQIGTLGTFPSVSITGKSPVGAVIGMDMHRRQSDMQRLAHMEKRLAHAIATYHATITASDTNTPPPPSTTLTMSSYGILPLIFGCSCLASIQAWLCPPTQTP